MKIITVYDLDNTPHLINTTRIKNIESIIEADLGYSDWECVSISKFINLVFVLKLISNEANYLTDRILVCGDINKLGDVINNGGKLPSTYHKFIKLWNKEYFRK